MTFDPIKNLPAAMIHCRKSSFSTLHIEDLNKGDNCSIVIKNGAERGIYTVDLFKFRSEETSIVNDGQIVANSAKSIVMFPRPENLVAETSQQQLIASVMMARRDWAHQHTNLWYNSFFQSLKYDSIKCPALMLIPMPIVMPVLLPNSDLTKNQCNNNADFRNEIRTGIHYLNSPKNIHFGNYKPEGRSDMRYINDNRASRGLRVRTDGPVIFRQQAIQISPVQTIQDLNIRQIMYLTENGQLRDVSSESGKQNSTCRRNNSKI
ncbi:unnamed protein product [Thelazia callipaeda]|uniref:Major sperm protein n=1 Tax=Thelazia callipaeda TaxID=103827 RepID=A0A0N5CRH9_THECL|nr:unnamed protein product [Thelazia callipaeda]